MRGPLQIAVAHPSAELYGSDLQLVETVAGFIDAGHHVQVTLPNSGPLAAKLTNVGATVDVLDFPVLRKSELNPRGLLSLVATSIRTFPKVWVRLNRTDLVWVNTLTIPLWLAVARLRGKKVFCHVHEAEDEGHRLVRTGLALPLALATWIICNSAAAKQSITSVLPLLARKAQVIHNGVQGPPQPLPPPRDRQPNEPVEIALVGRLSPRKGTDVALAAVAKLRSQDRDVRLKLYGDTFSGYEWFADQLRARSAEPDLAGAIEFAGFVHPTWGALTGADVVIVPSRVEPFGNTAVEALLAQRPLVASRTQGLHEIVSDGVTGLQAEPGDADSLAAAIARFIDDPQEAAAIAAAGRRAALERFTPQVYRSAILAAVSTHLGSLRGPKGRRQVPPR